MFDKEHFNTFELLDERDKEFYYHGHNRIYQYFLLFVMLVISFKVFFIYSSKKDSFKYYFILFIGVLFLQLINSYLIFLLNNSDKFNLYFYYLINIFIAIFFCYKVLKFNENN